MKKFVLWANSVDATDFCILHPYNQSSDCNVLGLTIAFLCLALDADWTPQPSATQPLIDCVHIIIPCSHGMMYSHHRARMLALETWTAILKQDNSKGETDKKKNCDNSAGSWRCTCIYG